MPNREDVIKDWSPGVLSQIQMIQLIENGRLNGIPADSEGIGLSSFDLHIADEAYRLLRGCIRPSGGGFREKVLQNHLLAERYEPNADREYRLKRQETYVFKLRESFNLEGTSDQLKKELYGQSTGKSSIGRLDVLVRMIAEGSELYDFFEGDSPGELFLEVTPITFDVVVREGTPLSQLRLFYGHPSLAQLTEKEVKFRKMLINTENTNCDTLGVDLTPSKLSDAVSAVGLRAKPTDDQLKLWVKNEYIPSDFWEPINEEVIYDDHRIVLEKDQFYILKSRELISLPSDVAVYCRAMDESLGEMRIHYAGFVHPYFGSNRIDDKLGTPLIFEVRGHNMNIVLRDKETLANLQFYRMSKRSERPKQDGPGQDYEDQDLKLSKLFKEWE